MRNRRKKIPLTEAQIKENRQKRSNYKNQKIYELKQRKLFFEEYNKICKKYGCYIGSLSGSFITKQKQTEKIYTIKSHIETLRFDLENNSTCR